MRLHQAAGRFDNVVATDAYGTDSFLCQLAPLDLYKIDGTAVKRRQMSTLPNVAMPVRRVIRIEGQPYLIGDSSPDFWRGTPIRNNYVMQGADHLAKLQSIGSALANSTPTEAYASLDFNKNMTDERDSSEYHSQYNVYLAGTESADPGTLIQIDTRWFLIHQSYVSVSGLLVTLCNELTGLVFETATFNGQTYNPLTDSYSASGSSQKIMRVRWTEHFQYLSRASEHYERADIQLFVLKGVTPKPSDTLTLSDGVWRVLSVIDEGAVWSLHVRRN